VPQRVKSAWGEWSVLQLTAVTIPPLLAFVLASGGSVAKDASYRLYKSGTRVSTVLANLLDGACITGLYISKKLFVCPVLKGRMSWGLS